MHAIISYSLLPVTDGSHSIAGATVTSKSSFILTQRLCVLWVIAGAQARACNVCLLAVTSCQAPSQAVGQPCLA